MHHLSNLFTMRASAGQQAARLKAKGHRGKQSVLQSKLARVRELDKAIEAEIARLNKPKEAWYNGKRQWPRI